MLSRLSFSVIAICLCALTASAQVPTATVTGRVVDSKGLTAPGVTVTATSPNLQGPRVTVTSENGDYSLPLLPPGEYTISFELSGFKPVKRTLSVASTQSVPLNVELSLAEITETVQVTADASPFLNTAQVATNIKQELMQTLPTSRSVTAAVQMAPNVRASGPGGQSGADGALSISGSMSFDSNYLINGVSFTENLRGQPVNLFIEDAIQETTISTGGISAEYGRFGGGMVNVITKSGGNDFSGSFRLSLNNDDWRAHTPFHETTLDKTIPTYEYTIGGPVVRDHLWFFNAGRFRKAEEARQTFLTNISYPRSDDEKRYEMKLTYSWASGQTVKGSYSKISQTILNANFQNPLDLKSLYTQDQPQDLISLNYNGLIGAKLAIEGQYSRRTLSFLNSGAAGTDLINDTLLIDRSQGGTAFRYWSPTFCTCNDDDRNNYEFLFKGTYFLSTSRAGAHSMVFGYDHYDDQRLANNHQSGSDYRILGTSTIIQGESITPVFLGNNSTIIQYDPITLASTGNNMRVHALFLNDAWQLEHGVTLNLGLRWDKNHGVDAAGNLISTGSRFSPRIGVAWDPANDGRWSITGSFAKYVSSINNGIADVSPAGLNASYQWFYQGPSINDGSGPTLTTPQAIQALFNWFNANGGTSRTPTSADIPGVNTFVGDNFNSPYSLEYATGVNRTIGQRGSVRVDYVFRDYRDFYVTRTDLTTGRTIAPSGLPVDINLIENSSDLKRQYQGGTVQANYRLGGLNTGVAYTLSRTWGNFDGENPASGPLSSYLFSYPEYRAARWNQPEGNLLGDQRHRARIWGTYRLPIPEGAGNVNVALIHTFASGVPLSAGGATSAAPGTGIGQINPAPYVTNPGYANPLGNTTTVEYFFFERDRFRTESQNRTDLALNYSFRVNHVDLFFRGDLLNVFNVYQLCGCGGTVFNNGGGSDIRTLNTAVQTASNAPATAPLVAFNPFTETPIEGVNWRRGPTFGQAASRFAYTTPRTFRFNFGVRF